VEKELQSANLYLWIILKLKSSGMRCRSKNYFLSFLDCLTLNIKALPKHTGSLPRRLESTVAFRLEPQISHECSSYLGRMFIWKKYGWSV